MAHRKCNLYKIYKDGVLLKTCDRESMFAYINIEPDTYYRNVRKGNNVFGKYLIEKITIAQQEIENKIKNEDKEETPFDCIVRLLEENGNTNLIKKELKYLPKLKKMFNLSVKHYKPVKEQSLCKDGDNSYTKEDWIITVIK